VEKIDNLYEIINTVTNIHEQLPGFKLSIAEWDKHMNFINNNIIPKLDKNNTKTKELIKDYEKNVKDKEYVNRSKQALDRFYKGFIKIEEEKFINEFPINNLYINRYFSDLEAEKNKKLLNKS